jgi:molecular chaperone GrpE
MNESRDMPHSSHEASASGTAGLGSDTLAAEPHGMAPAAMVADLRDKWLRAEAEIANVRTRAKRDVDDARLYAVQKFAADVVDGVENLRRGLDSLPPPAPGEPALVGKLRDGFAGIERNFLALLERNGIERQNTAGMQFDANRHEAMAEQESRSAPPGSILHAFSPGWTLNGRLLRPAKVVVAKAPPAPSHAPPFHH